VPAPVARIVERRIADRFIDKGAVSRDAAMTLDDLGIWRRGLPFEMLILRRYVVDTGDGTYYLDVEKWNDRAGRKLRSLIDSGGDQPFGPGPIPLVAQRIADRFTDKGAVSRGAAMTLADLGIKRKNPVFQLMQLRHHIVDTGDGTYYLDVEGWDDSAMKRMNDFENYVHGIDDPEEPPTAGYTPTPS